MKNDPLRHLRDNDEAEEQERPQGKGTVLVIDDDPSFLTAVREALTAEGFGVLTSRSGPKGLDMLRYASRDIRAVLLDYNMPGFDGAATLEFARKLNPTVKIFAVTGVDQTLLPASFREGVDRLLVKPFRNGELIDSLNAVFAQGGQTTSSASA
jgi:DNA-binding response OmpR family regulator